MLFKKEDRQSSEERQVLSRSTVSHPTAVFILSAISSVMLAILNGPMSPKGIEQLLWSRFMLPQAAEGITDIV